MKVKKADSKQTIDKNIFIQKLAKKAKESEVNLEKILSKGDTYQSGLCTKEKIRHNIEKKLYPKINAEELKLINTCFAEGGKINYSKIVSKIEVFQKADV